MQKQNEVKRTPERPKDSYNEHRRSGLIKASLDEATLRVSIYDIITAKKQDAQRKFLG